jgi:hypothetical protein
MRRVTIIALVCVNILLLLVLAWEVGAPPAKAQVLGGGSNYVLQTGRFGQNRDALFVLDLRTRRLLAFRPRKTADNQIRLRVFRGLRLLREFERGGGRRQP